MKLKKITAGFLVVLAATAVVSAATTLAADKLPKCSKTQCRSIGCPADVLCSSGTTVKTCADVCNGR